MLILLDWLGGKSHLERITPTTENYSFAVQLGSQGRIFFSLAAKGIERGDMCCVKSMIFLFCDQRPHIRQY